MQPHQRLTAIFVLPLTLACGGTGGTNPPSGSPSPAIYGIDSANTLIVFRATRPDLVTRTVAVTGLQTGERVAGIDFRPNDGKLYALGTSSRLYVVDSVSGAATAVGAGPFTPALAGTAFGFDVNPVVDLLRVVSDSNQNLRLSPVTGTVVGVDSALAFLPGDVHAGADPTVTAAAYSNSKPGASSTILYALDAAFAAFVTLPTPNSGRLSTVGSSGVVTAKLVGLDIDGASGVAYATFNPPATTTSQLYTVNLGTGTVILTGTVGHALPLVGIAVHP
ncbi:MAG: DUF4394 domain-containing protein [Gemmatimonadales bacterium]